MRIEDVKSNIEEKDVIKEEDIVKETWGNMSLGKKLEYLWMYYKSWLAGILILVMFICMGVSMYKNIRTTVLLNVVVVGGDDLKAEWLEESFVRYAGIEEGDGIVQVRTNIPDDGGGMTSTTALTTLIGAEAIDVLVCPKDVYEDYSSHEGFLNMEEVLGQDASEYEEAVLESGVCLEAGNILEKEEMTAYDEIYVTIPVSCQNKEMAARFVEYLLSGN